MRQDTQALSEIRTLLAAYNVAGDRMRLEALAATFTPAGVLETPTAVLRGREEIARGLAGGSRRDGPAPTLVRHHLTTSHVELQEADQAEARTYFIVYTEIGPDHAGHYLDRLQKTAEGWRIQHRRVRVDWVADATLFPALKPGFEARRRGRRS